VSGADSVSLNGLKSGHLPDHSRPAGGSARSPPCTYASCQMDRPRASRLRLPHIITLERSTRVAGDRKVEYREPASLPLIPGGCFGRSAAEHRRCTPIRQCILSPPGCADAALCRCCTSAEDQPWLAAESLQPCLQGNIMAKQSRACLSVA